mgnify:CR=1 FL=1
MNTFVNDDLKTNSLLTLLEQDRKQLTIESINISYYHPNIDRDKAEQLLKERYSQTNINGLFLLRDCTTSTHDFSLSIISNDKCFHYKIQLIYDIYFSIGKKRKKTRTRRKAEFLIALIAALFISVFFCEKSL